MPLAEVALTGFQSYVVRQSVPLEPHLTLVAGRNNVGKSGLLRGIWSNGEQQFGARSDFLLEVATSVDGEALARPFVQQPSLAEFTNALESRTSHTVRVELAAAGAPDVAGPLDQLAIERITLV